MLIRGEQLNAQQREQVKAAFVHRNTFEHPFPLSGGVQVSDAEWIAAHAFHFIKGGNRLSANHHYAVPAFLAVSPSTVREG